ARAEKIDALVLEGLTQASQSPNPRVADEQFVRRVYLDIAGRIPTADETQDYLADPSATKREALVDRLLMSDGYRSRMFNWQADMLRVRDRTVALRNKFY